MSAPSAISGSRTCNWMNCAPGCGVRSRCVFLWLAIDPRTKILPVLHLGPRTQYAAHLLIHSLRQLLAPDCLPLFTSDGLNLYFYAALGSLWSVAHLLPSRAQCAPVAGGSGLHLWPSEKMLPTSQAGSGHAGDAAGYTGRSLGRLTGDGLLRAPEHRFYRAGESDHPAWDSRAGSSHLGHGSAVTISVSSPRVVASVLSFCASSCLATGGAHAAARTRGQPPGAPVPAAYASHGSGKNQPTMDRS
jgi:hypothetical protein